MVQAIAQAASARPYSLTTNLISDLGNSGCGPAICSPLHGLINATFVLVGLLHLVGAVATWRAWPRYAGTMVGLALLAVAGVGLIIAGLAPENERQIAHGIGALIGLVSLNVAMIVLGSTLWEAARWLSIVTRVAGIVGLIGLGAFLNRAAGFPLGVVERIADYPGAAMVVVLGTYLLVSAGLGKRHSAKRA